MGPRFSCLLCTWIGTTSTFTGLWFMNVLSPSSFFRRPNTLSLYHLECSKGLWWVFWQE